MIPKNTTGKFAKIVNNRTSLIITLSTCIKTVKTKQLVHSVKRDLLL